MSERMPIALIGIGCRFPGGVTSVDAFWKLLVDGVDAITEIPPDRIDLEQFYDERPATPGRMMTRRGGFVGKLEDFDAMFFGIAPRDAERLDPQQRLLLETAWESLEDAGVDALALEGSTAGVFMGQWTSDFENRLFADVEAVDFPMTLGSGRYGAAARLSYALGLRGPSLSVDAACSSGLACVHLAVQSLRQGECGLALAGAANLILQPHIHIAYSQSRMMAPDGQCKFGDAGGDGYVRSEGIGVVVLKPLEAARRDGDRVYAVIHGSAVNNDGRSSGSMGRPSRIGQVELLQRAYADAGVPASAVGYIEAHGTGTRAGDPVELSALAEVLSPGRAADARAWVGSVKTNIGHTEATAGIAGLIKASLVLQHDLVPPSLHHHRPNPNIAWVDLPVAIPLQAQKLPVPAGRRLAGVSAYGIGGTNAHVVLEAAPAPDDAVLAIDEPSGHLLPLSARNDAALRELARRHADALASAAAPGLAPWCAAAAQRRSALELRAAFVAPDRDGMVDALRAFADGAAPAAAEGRVHEARPPGIVFVVPGQGAQWPGMARELMQRCASFRADLQACDAAMRPWADWSLVQELEAGSAFERIDQVQPVLVALAIAYARWLEARGIRPSAVVGHSMGEVAAACIAGVLSLEQAMRIVCRRSQLMSRTSGQGAMLLVDLSMAETELRVAAHAEALGVAVNNSPRSCVVSGSPPAIQRLMASLAEEGVFCRLVKVDVASHSPQMQPLADELAAELADLRPAQAALPIYSTVNAQREPGSTFDAAYWGRNLRQPVRFGEAIAAALADGHTVFVELSPHAVLSIAIQQNAQAAQREVAVLACGHREQADTSAALGMMGALWALGARPDWAALQGGPARHIDLPLYPWQRERHWVPQARPASTARQGLAALAPVPAEQLNWLNVLQWVPFDVSAEPAPTATGSAGAWLVVSSDEAAAQAVLASLGSAGLTAQSCAPQALAATLATGGLAGVLVLLNNEPGVAHQPLAVLQAMSGTPACTGARLWLATTGAQSVSGHLRPRVAVHAGAAWGTGRVLADEHPQQWGGMVDLDPEADHRARADQLVRHLLSDSDESQVAWRNGRRFALRLQPLGESGAEMLAPPWRPDGAYLVTGGLGDVGLRVAAGMVRAGARRLVLMGRHGLPAREQWQAADLDPLTAARVSAVRSLEAAGAAIHVIEADLGSAGDTERALRDYAAAAWPPIRGVVHAAGVLESQLALQVDRASFDRVLAPKLAGALHLDRLLPQLDCFIMFSSIIGVLGVAGTAAYAAANAGLDALAADRRARGLSALSLQWGPWEGLGMLGGSSGRSHMEGLRSQGVQGVSGDDGSRLFNALAGRSEASLAVVAMDWRAFGTRRSHALALVRGRSDTGSGELELASLSQRLQGLGPSERRAMLEPAVRHAVGAVLKLEPSRIDPRKGLGAMGLSSLMAMELRNRLEVVMGQPLSATLAWNYPNVEALVGFLAGSGAEGPVAATAAAALPAASSSLADVSALSDDEAARLLRKRR